MYLRFLFTFRESISRKQFISIAVPLLVVWRFVLLTISDLFVRYDLKLALSNPENTIVFDNNLLISQYAFILIIVLGLTLGALYATACVIIGRLRSQGWPLWMSIPMLASDILILQYLWIPLCLFKDKK